ncbi:MAG: hypothetical protein GY953_20040 [bacterium]|nr:hypothetical protein [bacterium]
MQGPRAQGNSVIVALLIVAALGIAAFFSIRLAIAHFRFSSATMESVSRAARLDPGNARYHLALATLLEIAGEDARAPLRRAAALTPLDATVWIRLGLQEEIHGRVREAEQCLIEAARLSKKFEARWTLANFYFRRDRRGEFWRWAREALAVSYGDRTALFRLCWQVEPDPAVIGERAIPENREVLMAWVGFLFAEQQDRAAASVVERLMGRVELSELGFFLRATDRLLSVGLAGSALQVWNELCGRGLVDRPQLDPASGEVVTNRDFLLPALMHGFGWRVVHPEGVFVAQRSGGWRISFSGNQPEECRILTQFVPLTAQRSYRFRSTYRSEPAGASSDNPDSGIRWSLLGLDGAPLGRSEPLATKGDGEVDVKFTVPAGVEGGRLVLHYRRATGSVRAEGLLTVRQVSIQGA